jgi:hypothetical protein
MTVGKKNVMFPLRTFTKMYVRDQERANIILERSTVNWNQKNAQ